MGAINPRNEGALMSNLKLFRYNDFHQGEVVEINSTRLEKRLKKNIEISLQLFSGVRILSGEHSTGGDRGRHIEALVINENDEANIIEYRCSLGVENAPIGHSYLEWLIEHREDFELMVIHKNSDYEEDNEEVEWSSPRCYGRPRMPRPGESSSYKHLDRDLELTRYRRFRNATVTLEIINAKSRERIEDLNVVNEAEAVSEGEAGALGGAEYLPAQLAGPGPNITGIFSELKEYIQNLGDDVQIKLTKSYFAFKRQRNFACVEIFPHAEKIALYLKLDPESVFLEEPFSRDVRGIGHLGTGDLEITIHTWEDFERAKDLILRSYEENI
jgi:predicted transport protein